MAAAQLIRFTADALRAIEATSPAWVDGWVELVRVAGDADTAMAAFLGGL